MMMMSMMAMMKISTISMIMMMKMSKRSGKKVSVATDLASSKKIDILEYNPSNVFARARDWSKCVT